MNLSWLKLLLFYFKADTMFFHDKNLVKFILIKNLEKNADFKARNKQVLLNFKT